MQKRPEPLDWTDFLNAGIRRNGMHAFHGLSGYVILTGFGWALVWLSWPALLAAVALIPFFHAKSCREEAFLREKFPGYREYEVRTRRFIPWLY